MMQPNIPSPYRTAWVLQTKAEPARREKSAWREKFIVTFEIVEKL